VGVGVQGHAMHLPKQTRRAIDLGVVNLPKKVNGLPRKEVIQPHLPVRLPCYDFVPIASPAFDGSVPYGFGHRLQASPTFMT
jgi:hypothetical protein